MQIVEARPPFVTFEFRAIEDRAASTEAGHYIAKDVAFAIVTPAGSKDRYENEVNNWFKMLEQETKENRFPAAWLRYYRDLYQAWVRDEAPPEDGTPLKNWPILSPAQLRTCKELHLRTIEDVAGCNEETIQRMGMGGRGLKQKALDWLSSAGTSGKTVELIASLRADNERYAKENEALREKVAFLTLRQRKEEEAPPRPALDNDLGFKL